MIAAKEEGRVAGRRDSDVPETLPRRVTGALLCNRFGALRGLNGFTYQSPAYPTQLLATYGVDSTVDLPQISIIVMGLDA